MTSGVDAQIAASGWVRLPSLLSPSEVETILAECDPLLAEPLERQRLGDRPHGGTRHLMELDERVDLVHAVMERHSLVQAVDVVVGPSAVPIQVSLRSPRPGHGGQSLHTDDVPLLGGGPDRVATAIVALTAFTSANGATRVVPGSHRRPDLQVRAGALASHPDEVLLIGGAGDAFVFSGHLLHSGTVNVSDHDRPALQITWRRGPE